MNSHIASAGFALMIIAATTSAANTEPVGQLPQIPPADGDAAATATLPEVVVHPDSWSYDPYVSSRGQKAGSLNQIPFSHFKVPAGYDADTALHPYTSGLGPCTEGASPSQGCRHPTGNPIPPSRYERAPFNQE